MTLFRAQLLLILSKRHRKVIGNVKDYTHGHKVIKLKVK